MGKLYMKLTNIKKKNIPFHKGETIGFHKGCVESKDGEEIFQYSISDKPHLGSYHMTLSFEHFENRTVIVSLIKIDNQNQVNIKVQNAAGQEIWDNEDHKKHTHVKKAFHLILQEHL